MYKSYLGLCTLAAVQAYPLDHFGVIVAGGSHWEGYNSQANACHAYQILR